LTVTLNKKTGARRFKIALAFLPLVLAFLAGQCNPAKPDTPSPEPRNVILMIGDGMGAGQRQAARWFSGGTDGRLLMDCLPAQGWSSTCSANSPITDSAAAATAMACGVKTNNGVLGMTPSLQALANILEEAQRLGKAVGLVTTTQLTNATPAGFIAHVPSRSMEDEIALQMLASGADVLLGGGENHFLPYSTQGCHPAYGMRSDGRNLVEEAIASGYTLVCTSETFTNIDPASTRKLIGLFADEALSRPYAPSLAAMTEKAIAILSLNANGFFLMVEGGQIDNAGHDHDATVMIADTLGFDEAVSQAWRFAETNQNTLIIVTADHETGGVSVSLQPAGSEYESGPLFMPNGTPFWVAWTTSGHTGADVPLSAGGPFYQELFSMFVNTHIFEIMRLALDEP
jgi:alkaline phosphatase